MQKVYVPYKDDVPAAVYINGHRVLIVCSESKDIVADLPLPSDTEIREMEIAEDDATQSQVLADLAAGINGGVVVTPPGISAKDLIANLEQELPWIH